MIYTVVEPPALLARFEESSLPVSIQQSPIQLSQEDLIRLVEDLSQAIAEFAPGSELILGEDAEVVQVRLTGGMPDSANVRAVAAIIPGDLRIEWLPQSVQEPQLHDNVPRSFFTPVQHYRDRWDYEVLVAP